MRQLFRAPLTWMVIAEFAVVAALAVFAWNAVARAAHPAPALTVPQSDPTTTDAAASPLPDLPGGTRPSPGPGPGLNLDSSFWRQRLAQLNGEQVYFEQLEWRVVHTALDAAERYIHDVVVPSVQRAERGGG